MGREWGRHTALQPCRESQISMEFCTPNTAEAARMDHGSEPTAWEIRKLLH